MKATSRTVDLPIVNGESSAVLDLGHMSPDGGTLYFQIAGTFVASYKPEFSVDGTNWSDASKFFTGVVSGVALAAVISAPVLIAVRGGAPLVRFTCTAFTSATAPTVTVYGADSRTT